MALTIKLASAVSQSVSAEGSIWMVVLFLSRSQCYCKSVSFAEVIYGGYRNLSRWLTSVFGHSNCRQANKAQPAAVHEAKEASDCVLGWHLQEILNCVIKPADRLHRCRGTTSNLHRMSYQQAAWFELVKTRSLAQVCSLPDTLNLKRSNEATPRMKLQRLRKFAGAIVVLFDQNQPNSVGYIDVARSDYCACRCHGLMAHPILLNRSLAF
jgi:hypothetical protein